jgi:uracil-DNA glycosylase family 4
VSALCLQIGVYLVKRTVSQVPECNGCPFQKLFPTNTFVAPKIGTNRRLVVAEAPGQAEQDAGEPLVGGAGKVAASLYAKAGIKLDDCTKLNVIQCRPPNNIFPDTAEARSYCTKAEGQQAIQHCVEHHTLPVVRSERWELGRWQKVDLLGGKALRYIAGKEGGINRWRGSILQLPQLDYGPNAVPTLHPAYVMRDWNQGVTVISDLKKSLVIPPQNYNCYPSLQDAQNYTAKRVVVDLESNRFSSEILLVGFSDKPHHATVFPFHGPYIPEIKRIISEADEIITQNGCSFDVPLLKKNGIFPKATCEINDTILAHALVSPDQDHDLGYLTSIYTNLGAYKHTAEINKEFYCATDCDSTFQIWQQLKPLLKQLGLWDIYSLVSLPAAMICSEMKRLGVKLDHSKVRDVRERIIKEQATLETKIPAKLRTQEVPVNRRIPAAPGTLGKSGKPVKFTLVPSSETVVPWRSSKSVGEWVYGDLKLPEQKQVKTGKRTVDKTALAKLVKHAGENAEAIKALMRLNGLDELLTTFAKENFKYSDTIHANFNVHGTAQGRLSSSEPNMQNWPEEARCIIVPHQPGWKLMSFDFSQLENRLTAHLAGDEERLRRFLDPDFNEHKWAASVIFDLPYDSIEKDNSKDAPYGRGKRINHGTAYRMGPRKIANMYDLVEREVKQQQAKLLAKLDRTIKWQDSVAEQAKSDGYLTNAFGRKRWFNTPNYFTESASFHAQSCGADIILRCMVGLVYERIGWPVERVAQVSPIYKPIPRQSNLLLQVHDNLTFEYHPSVELELYDAATAVMTQPWRGLGGFNCPVSCETGNDWGPIDKYGTLTKFQPRR